jgi:hypothetical protein
MSAIPSSSSACAPTAAVPDACRRAPAGRERVSVSAAAATCAIDPAALALSAGTHVLTLKSMLLTATKGFRSS